MILIWTLYLLLSAMRWDGRVDRLFPLLVGTITSALLLGKIGITIYVSTGGEVPYFRAFSDGIESIGSTDMEIAEETSTWGNALVMIVWIIAFPGLVYIFGFMLSTFVFITAFLYYYTKNPLFSVGVSTSTTVILNILMFRLLNVLPWEGVLF